MCIILEANYQKDGLSNITSSSKHSNSDDKIMLYYVLTKYELLFDGTLGTWKKKPVDIELQPLTKQHHPKSYPVPHVHESVFKKKKNWLYQLRLLKNVNCSEWGAPAFIKPKNNGTVRLLSNFRKLNQIIRRKPVGRINGKNNISRKRTYAETVANYVTPRVAPQIAIATHM